MLKNKKGQMYIIMAIVICLAVYSVIISTNTLTRIKRVSAFPELVENIHTETSSVEDANPGDDDKFITTIGKLVEYMEKTNPDAGMLIMKDSGGETLVYNNMDQGIYVIAKGLKRYLAGNKEKIKGTIGISDENAISIDSEFQSLKPSIGTGEQIDLSKFTSGSITVTESGEMYIIAFGKVALEEISVKEKTNMGKHLGQIKQT